MEKSKVYFTNFRATVQENIQQKLVRLMKTAGMDSIDFDKNIQRLRFILVNRVIWPISGRIMQKQWLILCGVLVENHF